MPVFCMKTAVWSSPGGWSSLALQTRCESRGWFQCYWCRPWCQGFLYGVSLRKTIPLSFAQLKCMHTYIHVYIYINSNIYTYICAYNLLCFLEAAHETYAGWQLKKERQNQMFDSLIVERLECLSPILAGFRKLHAPRTEPGLAMGCGLKHSFAEMHKSLYTMAFHENKNNSLGASVFMYVYTQISLYIYI